jgi:hypothetical protein
MFQKRPNPRDEPAPSQRMIGKCHACGKIVDTTYQNTRQDTGTGWRMAECDRGLTTNRKCGVAVHVTPVEYTSPLASDEPTEF